MKLNEVARYQRPMLTPEEAQVIRDIYIAGHGIDMPEGVEEKLYLIFAELGEMPYGVAKARTGDPSQWIDGQLSRMGPAWLEKWLDIHTA